MVHTHEEADLNGVSYIMSVPQTCTNYLPYIYKTSIAVKMDIILKQNKTKLLQQVRENKKFVTKDIS